MAKLGFLSRLLGDSNEKELKRIWEIVDEINDLAGETAALSDEALAARTATFKERLRDGDDLDDLLPEAFATVREMAARRVGERPYDVQLVGGIVLHEGRIAEMKTGEGKTLTAVAPVYLNALLERGVHVVTVNDYLARRDAAWYGPVYHALGLTVGVVQTNGISFMYEPGYRPGEEGGGGHEFLRPCDRRDVYHADITYGTNNEFGFDYLRDNMAQSFAQKVQRDLCFAIVDEVDNILIDEARTPLIISGNAEEASGTYIAFARAVRTLVEEQDFQVDHKSKHVALTEEGIEKLERALKVDNLFGQDPRLVRHLEAALDAEVLKRIDRDYVVRDGEIVIVDEFTGRLMPGRRWSHGIHQAVEAKEGLKVQRESVTHATITFQNLFRLYEKLSGMTGTAETEAEEFHKIYKLEVVVIPTHRPMIRKDSSDVVYINEKAKFNAVVNEIVELNAEGRPVLVGTTSIEKSEYLATLLTRKGIQHNVLNAKQHEREAHIVAEAGQRGAVTIATNMAGRGTDIKLGPGVAGLGGLHVIGTERHESRRIDNQLRGRSGRQGDPGSSRFFVSFGDDIMKRFAPEWVPGMMQKLGMTEEMPLESRMVTRAIEQAQQKVEGHNFDIRKRLVEFDDVINEHRTVIYAEREKILRGADTRANVLGLLIDDLESLMRGASAGNLESQEVLQNELREILHPDDLPSLEEMEELGDELSDEVLDRAEDRYEQMEETIGAENMRRVEHWLLLETIDYHWREHLTAVEDLRQSIGLQAYAQVDPLVAFKREGYDMFQQLQANIRRQVARTIFKVRMVEQPAPTAAPPAPGEAVASANGEGAARATPVLARSSAPSAATLRTNRDQASSARTAGPAKPGRNDPCYCGSGKKYKRCHGA
ncbi:MAG: preprotein translocase subunit SecA [Thermoflexaceae bacterium]|nr:preprotein translocase subunit SecA [Thermoflexaceae bacterium]